MIHKTRLIVTHHNPDLDAAGAVWLIKRFWPNWQGAQVKFVLAGETRNGQPPDIDPDVVYVDTGKGRFDHHQTDAFTCATKLVLEEAKKKWPQVVDKALERLVEIINAVDHFQEACWPDPTHDRYELMLPRIIDGWQATRDSDQERCQKIAQALDGVYAVLKNKVWAEKELREKGVRFNTPWGKGIGIETINDEVIPLAQKQGFRVVVRKDPRKGYVRIKSLPVPKIDLSAVYQVLKKEDPEATWFFHPSRHMILNGSTRNPKMKPTALTLTAVITLLKNLK